MPTGKICPKCGQYREYCDYGKHHKTLDGHRKICNYCAGKSGPKVTKNSSVILRTPTPKSPTSHLLNAAKNHPPLFISEEEMTPFEKASFNVLKLEASNDLDSIAELVKLRMEQLNIQSKIFKLSSKHLTNTGAQNP